MIGRARRIYLSFDDLKGAVGRRKGWGEEAKKIPHGGPWRNLKETRILSRRRVGKKDDRRADCPLFTGNFKKKTAVHKNSHDLPRKNQGV